MTAGDRMVEELQCALSEGRAPDPELLAALESDAETRETARQLIALHHALAKHAEDEIEVPEDLHQRIVSRLDTSRRLPRRRTAMAGAIIGAAAAIVFIITLDPSPGRIGSGQRDGTEQPIVAAPVRFPSMSISNELLTPKRAIERNGDVMLKSAGSFMESVGRLLPELPGETDRPEKEGA